MLGEEENSKEKQESIITDLESNKVVEIDLSSITPTGEISKSN